MTKIVVLDGFTTNPGDLSWKPIQKLGRLKVFNRTSENLIYERAKDAEIIISNKTILSYETLKQLKKLKCICVLATGYNNIDVVAAKSKGIIVCNAVGYSAPSVAQHVFSFILSFSNNIQLHNNSVQNNDWANSPDWCFWDKPLIELNNKTIGIYGLGKIGEQVAEIALAFGMKVIAHRKSDKTPSNKKVKMVDLNTLFAESDILTLHAPLTSENKELINAKSLTIMKSTAWLINTGRGGLVNENDLKMALINNEIAAAGLDVLSEEPPKKNNPLTGLPNCLITPHQAWATIESRKRLIKIVAENIKGYLKSEPKNVVNL